MVNFGPLAAEIDPVVWGTPANFNGFRVLAALLHGLFSDMVYLPGNFYNLNNIMQKSVLSEALSNRSY